MLNVFSSFFLLKKKKILKNSSKHTLKTFSFDWIKILTYYIDFPHLNLIIYSKSFSTSIYEGHSWRNLQTSKHSSSNITNEGTWAWQMRWITNNETKQKIWWTLRCWLLINNSMFSTTLMFVLQDRYYNPANAHTPHDLNTYQNQVGICWKRCGVSSQPQSNIISFYFPSRVQTEACLRKAEKYHFCLWIKQWTKAKHI